MKTLVLLNAADQITRTIGPVITNDSKGQYIQFSFTDGTAAGSIQLQISADGLEYFNSGTPTAVAAGATTGIEVDSNSKYKRFEYTSSAGAGTMTVVMNLKEVYEG